MLSALFQNTKESIRDTPKLTQRLQTLGFKPGLSDCTAQGFKPYCAGFPHGPLSEQKEYSP